MCFNHFFPLRSCCFLGSLHCFVFLSDASPKAILIEKAYMTLSCGPWARTGITEEVHQWRTSVAKPIQVAQRPHLDFQVKLGWPITAHFSFLGAGISINYSYKWPSFTVINPCRHSFISIFYKFCKI